MINSISLASIVILFIILFITWFVIQRLHAFNYFSRLQIRGPKPDFIFGNVRQLFVNKNPLKQVQEWKDKYGRVFGYYEGCKPSLFVFDPEIIKDVMVKEFPKFMNRPQLMELKDPFDKLLSEATGDTWKRIRITLSPAFTGNKLKQMSRVMDESMETFLEILKEKADRKEEFDISILFSTLTMEMIVESVFALKIDCQRDPSNKLYQGIKSHFHSVTQLVNMMPFVLAAPKLVNILLKILSKFGGNKIMSTIKWLLDVAEKLVNERKLLSQSERIDMTQLMINAVDESLEDSTSSDDSENAKGNWNLKKGLTNKEISINTLMFLLAGAETTYNSLSFVARQLTVHPEIQQSVQEEIDRFVVGEVPTYEEVQQLHYLDSVINETMRMFPAVALFLSRRCTESCVIKGIPIKKGMTIHMPPMIMHYDEEFWSEPQNFDPSRFSNENKGNIVPMSYLPFGNGPRNCIGQRLALLKMKLALVVLLKHFTILKGQKFETILELDSQILILKPKNGVSVMIQPRQSKQHVESL